MVLAKAQSSVGALNNAILRKLSQECLDRFQPHLKGIELEIKKVIYNENQPAQSVYFVETGMISVVSVMRDGGSIEVSTIGKEGLAGSFLLLGVTSIPYQQYVQIA